MRYLFLAFLLFINFGKMTAQTNDNSTTFDAHAAERFANLALGCVHKEYPNKLSHSLNSDADVAPPRKLTPAFYGCYDWHSSVHGHWLLVRLIRRFPTASIRSIGARGASAKSDGPKHHSRGSISAGGWAVQLRATLRT